MTKHNLFSDSTASILDDPIDFLKSFILLVVPTGFALRILIAGTYAENIGHEFIGGLLLFAYNAADKITLFIFETFFNLVVYAVVIIVIVTSVLEALGIRK